MGQIWFPCYIRYRHPHMYLYLDLPNSCILMSEIQAIEKKNHCTCQDAFITFIFSIIYDHRTGHAKGLGKKRLPLTIIGKKLAPTGCVLCAKVLQELGWTRVIWSRFSNFTSFALPQAFPESRRDRYIDHVCSSLRKWYLKVHRLPRGGRMPCSVQMFGIFRGWNREVRHLLRRDMMNMLLCLNFKYSHPVTLTWSMSSIIYVQKYTKY